MKKTRIVLSFVLALALALSMVPTIAFATESPITDQSESTIVKRGSSVTLFVDVQSESGNVGYNWVAEDDNGVGQIGSGEDTIEITDIQNSMKVCCEVQTEDGFFYTKDIVIGVYDYITESSILNAETEYYVGIYGLEIYNSDFTVNWKHTCKDGTKIYNNQNEFLVNTQTSGEAFCVVNTVEYGMIYGDDIAIVIANTPLDHIIANEGDDVTFDMDLDLDLWATEVGFYPAYAWWAETNNGGGRYSTERSATITNLSHKDVGVYDGYVSFNSTNGEELTATTGDLMLGICLECPETHYEIAVGEDLDITFDVDIYDRDGEGITYEWLESQDGGTCGNTKTLSITDADENDARTYCCVVIAPYGIITSPEIVVDVVEETETDTEPEGTVKGDINGDGILDVIDVAMARANIVGTKTLDEEQIKCGDMNDDGIIDVIDVALMRNTIING